MEFIISRDFHEVRLDRFLRKKYREVALPGIFRMIRKGRVKVNGRKRKPAYRLQLGDTVSVFTATNPSPEKILPPLSAAERNLAASIITLEDEDLLICNKPPGMVMHRGSGHHRGLLELLQAYSCNPQFAFVNRIDRDTAGLVVGAKHPAAARKLSALFREQGVAKYYLAMVEGRIDRDRITRISFLTREDDRVTESDRDSAGGRRAASSFTVLQRRGERTLVQARLFTGRTHQLRVQLAGLGHPIVGDQKYGRGGRGRMLLFSQRIVIAAMGLDIELPVPEYFNV